MRTKTRLRITYVVAAVASLGAVAWLIAGPFRSNVLYYRTPTEAVAKRGDSDRFRLAGEVVSGSVVEGSGTIEFDVTDGETTVHVLHDGEPPQLFGEDVPVVAEGSWEGEVFASDRIMIRHGNEYSPPEVTEGSAPG